MTETAATNELPDGSASGGGGFSTCAKSKNLDMRRHQYWHDGQGYWQMAEYAAEARLRFR